VTHQLFLGDAAGLAAAAPGATVVLDGDEGRHAAAVVRVRVGERYFVADGLGRRVLAEAEQVDKTSVRGRVLEVIDEPEPEVRFVLVQALAKGGRDEQAVEAATELGVDVVVPWQAGRSVVRWRGAKAATGPQRWEAVVAAATKQSRRMHLPEVKGLAGQDDVEALVRDAALALVLHEGAGMPLASVALPASGSVVLVVGPEGGIDPGEVAALEAAGGIPVRLGRELLRSSTAGPAALAVLSARQRWA
jgi:16S rRNA (uracil1498-N3)-methyltransferase